MWLDEFNLIQEVQSGNLDSFTPLYEMYFDKIYSFLLMKANGNVQLAEDATASTFIKAFESIDKFSLDEPNSSFWAWLLNIWYHSLLDLFKRYEYEDLDENNLNSWNIDYVDYFQKHIQSEQILAYLDELWWDKKDLFILRIWNNLSYDEIWEILWKRGSSCRKDFSRLIKKIANHFKHWIDS